MKSFAVWLKRLLTVAMFLAGHSFWSMSHATDGVQLVGRSFRGDEVLRISMVTSACGETEFPAAFDWHETIFLLELLCEDDGMKTMKVTRPPQPGNEQLPIVLLSRCEAIPCDFTHPAEFFGNKPLYLSIQEKSGI